jgi:hypothetical protein
VQAEEWEATFQVGSPEHLAFVVSMAAATVHEYVPSPEAQYAVGVRNQAADLLERRARIPRILVAYDALNVHASLRAEVALHMGYLEAVRMNWAVAQAHLDRVRHLTDEAFLRYLGELFLGQVGQAIGDHPGAMAAFQRAQHIVPGARSALTLLAAELMLVGSLDDWNRAEAALRSANAPGAPDDPWRLYHHGDARLWPKYMSALREALANQ